MVIKKEIKDYGNRRQINIGKKELIGVNEVYLCTENEMLNNNTTDSNITTEIQQIKDKLDNELNNQNKIDELNKLNNLYDAKLKDIIDEYNSLFDDVQRVSWTNAILNRFKKVLNNRAKMKRTDIVKQIQSDAKQIEMQTNAKDVTDADTERDD